MMVSRYNKNDLEFLLQTTNKNIESIKSKLDCRSPWHATKIQNQLFESIRKSPIKTHAPSNRLSFTPDDARKTLYMPTPTGSNSIVEALSAQVTKQSKIISKLTQTLNKQRIDFEKLRRVQTLLQKEVVSKEALRNQMKSMQKNFQLQIDTLNELVSKKVEETMSSQDSCRLTQQLKLKFDHDVNLLRSEVSQIKKKAEILDARQNCIVNDFQAIYGKLNSLAQDIGAVPRVGNTCTYCSRGNISRYNMLTDELREIRGTLSQLKSSKENPVLEEEFYTAPKQENYADLIEDTDDLNSISSVPTLFTDSDDSAELNLSNNDSNTEVDDDDILENIDGFSDILIHDYSPERRSNTSIINDDDEICSDFNNGTLHRDELLL